MEVTKGSVHPISPPAPEADNPMTLDEAIGVVNIVLGSQFRAFDRLRGALTTAKNLAAQHEDAEKAVDRAKEELQQVQKQISLAKGQRTKVIADLETKQKAAEAAIAQAQQTFQDDMQKQKSDLTAELQEQARVAQVNLEDNIAGLKREQGALAEATRKAKEELDALTAAVTDKNVELTSVQSRLDTANTALDALKKRL